MENQTHDLKTCGYFIIKEMNSLRTLSKNGSRDFENSYQN